MPDATTVLPPPHSDGRPNLDTKLAGELAGRLFGKLGAVQELPSYSDQNFRIGDDWVLKVSHASTERPALEAQHAAIAHIATDLPSLALPTPTQGTSGDPLARLPNAAGGGHWIRLCRWVPGEPLGSGRPQTPRALEGFGRLFGGIADSLATFAHPGAQRTLVWDLRGAVDVVSERLPRIADGTTRDRIADAVERFYAGQWPLMGLLPGSVVHNDLNTDNLVVGGSGGDTSATGLLDFGDLVESVRLADLAIGSTYLMLEQSDPLATLEHIVRGYHAVMPLLEVEREMLLPLIRMRLCVSIAMAADTEARRGSGDEYLTSSQRSVRALLSTLVEVDDLRAQRRIERGLGIGSAPRAGRAPGQVNAARILAARTRALSPSLSLSYAQPLHIVRGRGAYLFDAAGEAFLDCVNNIAHVGHEHPAVVEALHRQSARLNTNTRYLHELRPRYAERLLALFPDRFEVCFLVCSGSEANELALRLARTATGGRNMVVLQSGYHGNTSSLIGLSSYKYDGPGGQGRPDWVEEAPAPDPYRGIEAGAADAGAAYAGHVAAAAERARAALGGLAGFLAEPILGCAGQIVPPDGFLRTAVAEVQARGGVAIADEVQVGFGRVGEAWWAFELDGTTPDIVTLGKPIGNGHPMGAVVTTRAVAEAFHNGMEYFNSFGGNPVSCAVGLAVLDVLEGEGLRENARTVGGELLAALQALKHRHPSIGDVRGRGLYIGVEFVSDRDAKVPDPDIARSVVERLRLHDRILLSVDGPDHNVVKIKPPLVFAAADAQRLVAALDTALDGIHPD